MGALKKLGSIRKKKKADEAYRLQRLNSEVDRDFAGRTVETSDVNTTYAKKDLSSAAAGDGDGTKDGEANMPRLKSMERGSSRKNMRKKGEEDYDQAKGIGEMTAEDIESGFAFRYLSQVEDVDLSGRGAQKIGQQGRDRVFKNVHYLNLASNKLDNSTIHPMHIHRMFPNLVELNLSDNRLYYGFPRGLCQFEHLRVLHCSSNRLESLPSAIYWMTNLEEINASTNHIKKIPKGIKALRKLREFNVGGNPMKRLPELGKLSKSLRVIRAHACHLESITPVHKIESLHELYLNGNRLTAMPTLSGEDQKHLHAVDLSNNHIDVVNVDICLVHSLTYLSLSRNLIESLPEEIVELHKLKVLRVDSNKISKLPSNFFLLKSLQELDISNNQIEELPAAIDRCKHLVQLNFAGNKIKTLHPFLNRLEKLDGMKVSNNPLNMKDPGTVEVLSFYVTKFGGGKRIDFNPRRLINAIDEVTGESVAPLSVRMVEAKAAQVVVPHVEMHSYADAVIDRHHKYEEITNTCHIFAKLYHQEKLSLCSAMKRENFKRAETIFNQGDRGHKFYIVYKGTVDFGVTVEDGRKLVVGTAVPGSYFGESVLTSSHDTGRPVTAVGGTKGCILLSLSRKTFEAHCGSFASVQQRQVREVMRIF